MTDSPTAVDHVAIQAALMAAAVLLDPTVSGKLSHLRSLPPDASRKPMDEPFQWLTKHLDLGIEMLTGSHQRGPASGPSGAGTPPPAGQEVTLELILQRLDRIEPLIHDIKGTLKAMSDAFSTEMNSLRADVTAQSTVIASATAAFNGLVAQLQAAEQTAMAAGATAAQIASVTAIRQGFEANTAALAAAIPANTPAASTPAASTPAASTPAADATTPTPEQPASADQPVT